MKQRRSQNVRTDLRRCPHCREMFQVEITSDIGRAPYVTGTCNGCGYRMVEGGRHGIASLRYGGTLGSGG